MPVAFAAVLVLGICIGNFYAKKTQYSKSSTSAYSKIRNLLQLIDNEYVDAVNIDSIAEAVLPTILVTLDPHSVYIPQSELQMVDEELSSSFSGIGVQFNILNDTVLIVAVISGGPSEKLGIQPGDRIVTVNDTSFVGKDITNEKVLKKLRGPKNTTVKVGIKRTTAKDLLTYNIVRGDVPVNSIDASYVIEPRVGYIRVSKFGSGTYKEFLTSIASLKNDGAHDFIVDLRGNSGGYLDAAIRMINEFLHKRQLIVYTEGKSYRRANSFADGNGSCRNSKIIVLIDEWSASASEIFAGAIQDNDRGLIIGRRSFGKGLVQQQIAFNDGSAVRLTVARYYTPAGRCIQKPYKKSDADEYGMDILNRYLHGEIDTQDSIQIKDTLEYKTSLGRTVYGGGGIMPDIFVPRDTSGITNYYNKVANAGYLFEFAFKYADENRERLKTMKSWEQLLAQLQQEDILWSFAEYAERKGVKRNPYSLQISGKVIVNALHAHIVRNMLGNEAFYAVLNKTDKTIERALEEMRKMAKP